MASKQELYSPLSPKSGSIRLLRVRPPHANKMIHCELSNGNVETSGFKALSYVWGSPLEEFPIELNGKSWKVRRSLWHFLRKAEIFCPNEPIWIDALCINQDDIPERNQQVSQMCKIYNRAELVLVWLEDEPKAASFFSQYSDAGDWNGPPPTNGPEPQQPEKYGKQPGRDLVAWQGWADPAETLHGAVEPFDDDFDALEPWSDQDREIAVDLFSNIGSHPYWERSWVVQEFCLANDILFLFEDAEIAYQRFESAFLSTNPDKDTHPPSIIAISELIFWRQGNNQQVSIDSKLEYPVNLYELLVRFGSRKCQDLRDRVFSLIGLSEEPGSLAVDYGMDLRQLYVEVLRYLSVRGTPRFDAAIRLFEMFKLSLTDVTTNMPDLPGLKFVHLLAGGLLVLNGTGGVARGQQLWLCQCRQCNDLSRMIPDGQQVVLRRTSLQSLWLLYLRTAPQSTGRSAETGETAIFEFVACAQPFTASGHTKRGLCAYLPKDPLIRLYHNSQLRFRNGMDGMMEILLDEKSIFAEAFLASFAGSASVSQLLHSSMDVPADIDLNEYGSLGVVHYE